MREIRDLEDQVCDLYLAENIFLMTSIGHLCKSLLAIIMLSSSSSYCYHSKNRCWCTIVNRCGFQCSRWKGSTERVTVCEQEISIRSSCLTYGLLLWDYGILLS